MDLFVSRVGTLALCSLGLVLSLGCGSSSSAGDGNNGATTGGGSSGGGSGTGATSGGGTSNGGGTNNGGYGGTWGGVGGSAPGCTGQQCCDGQDNDGDGLIDGFDPECTSPYDNDEGTFATGIPGDNIDPKWQDCFFDGNSGAGDDGCRYSTDCLTGKLPQTSPDCTVTDQCVKFCKPLVSNGCDCFGCCTVATPTGSIDIQIGVGCSVDKASDATACPTCTKSTLCQNDCGTCELCLGKTEADLPASCKPAPVDAGVPTGPDGSPPPPPPPSYTCDTGLTVCSATVPCVGNFYCSLGCCHPILR